MLFFNNNNNLRGKVIDKKSALKHFSLVDQKFYQLAKKLLPKIDLPETLPASRRAAELLRIIVGQQISTKAASSIWQKLGPQLLKADGQLKNPSQAELLQNGASGPKARYLLAVSQAIRQGRLDLKDVDDLSDEEIISRLVQQPGIGRWTAEMFLIRALGRPDVFSLGDLGIRTALLKLNQGLGPKSDLSCFLKKYSPHGSLAALVCWRSFRQWLKALVGTTSKTVWPISFRRQLAAFKDSW